MNHNFQDLRTAREMLKRKPLQINGKSFSKMRGMTVAYIESTMKDTKNEVSEAIARVIAETPIDKRWRAMRGVHWVMTCPQLGLFAGLRGLDIVPVETLAEAQTFDGRDNETWKSKPTVQIDNDWETEITRPTKPGSRQGYSIGILIQGGARDFAEANANAALIAAAPELYEALAQIYRTNKHEDYTYDQREEIIERICKDAFAKAEGR
jgi:hypothetical protein